MPFDMESVELDFQILDPDADGLEMSVLLVAAKRELIESKMRMLTDAGLEPAVVDVEAFALHNAFELNHPDAMNGVVGLLNIGHDVTNINILDDGVPLLTRDLTVGARRFREDLQRERGLSADDAQALIQGYDRSPHLDAVIETRGEEIAVGIERAAAFLAQNSRAEADALDLHVRRRLAHSRAQRDARQAAQAHGPAGEPAGESHRARRRARVARHRRDRAAAHVANRTGTEASRMIEINLLPSAGKKKATRRKSVDFGAMAAGASGKFRDKFLIGSVVAVVAGIGAGAGLYTQQTARESELAERKDRAVRDSTRYATFLKDRYRAEADSRHAAPRGQHHPQSRRRPLRVAARARRSEPRASAVHVAHDARLHRRAAGQQQRRRSRRRKMPRRPPKSKNKAPKRLVTEIPRDQVIDAPRRPHRRHPGADAVHEGSRRVAVSSRTCSSRSPSSRSIRARKSRSSS